MMSGRVGAPRRACAVPSGRPKGANRDDASPLTCAYPLPFRLYHLLSSPVQPLAPVHLQLYVSTNTGQSAAANSNRVIPPLVSPTRERGRGARGPTRDSTRTLASLVSYKSLLVSQPLTSGPSRCE